MKIEYDGVYANVLKHCPLPCLRCVFFKLPRVYQANLFLTIYSAV